MVRGFAAVILVGAALLSLPVASRTGTWTSPLTALFTSVSATCVTGLTVVDVGMHFSLFGQGILLALIQLGGLGIMTFSTFLLVLVGRRLGIDSEFVLMDSLGYAKVRGLPSLLRRVVWFTLALELAGALVVGLRLMMGGLAPERAFYHGLFHAVSAFCNAGFSLYPENLMAVRNDSAILLTLAALVVLGGLGFLVLYDLSALRFWLRNRVQRGRIGLHTQIVLRASGLLVAVGAVAFALLEWDGVLAGLSTPRRLLFSLFQGITPRTAGFNVVDITALQPATFFMTMTLMFIGGSPCSTGGGVKTTTVVVLFMVMRSFLRGRHDVEIHGRRVKEAVVREALTIVLVGIVVVFVGFYALTITEAPALAARSFRAADELLFEVVSAFGTVGLSAGVTPQLSPAGRVIIMVVMFVGRLGPLTMALLIARRGVRQVTRYPEGDVVVG